MIHLPDQIQDLGFILIVAAMVTLVFKWLRQPVVLGYLVAGFLVGPHVPFLPNIADPEGVKIWAEIGVIFLLFGLGLEFSFKKLARVGKTASITAGLEVIFMLSVGYLAGRLLGWSNMDSLFLGGILSISSTTIIVRAFEELGLKGRHFVSLVFGVLIVEDLIAILLLALLSTIAATQSVAGGTLLLSSLKLGFFLVLWFLVGIYVVPAFLRRIQGYLNGETTLVVSIALCLLMVIVATKVGFSPALGAFVMGSILAETRDGHRIEQLMMPVKDLFAAIFFVSVGMLIDPKVLYEYGGVIVLITLLTIGGKFFSSAMGALLSGQSLRHAVQAGMSLSQIGEFSFIIATLGLTLGVTSDFLYPIAVAVSAITTFTTPYQIREADRFANFLERKLPAPLLTRLDQYRGAFHDRGSKDSPLTLLWEAYGMKVALNGVMIVAIILGSRQILLPALNTQLGVIRWLPLAVGSLALAASAPFFWAIFLGRVAKGNFSAPALERLKALQTGATIARVLVGAALLLFLVSQFAPSRATFGFALLIALLFGALFSRFAEPVYGAMEKRFLLNLDDKDRAELEKTPTRPALAPWNATLAELVLSPDSDLAGKTLMDSAIKEKFGVTVALIERGNRRILAPGRGDLLMPFDRLHLIGTEEQILAARPAIERAASAQQPLADFSYGLEAIRLPAGSPFLQKPIRDSGLREAINGLIVGIERDGKRILNPDSTTRLSVDDLIWVVGDRERIRAI